MTGRDLTPIEAFYAASEHYLGGSGQIFAYVPLTGQLDAGLLRRALVHLQFRHPALRSVVQFGERGDAVPVLVAAPEVRAACSRRPRATAGI